MSKQLKEKELKIKIKQFILENKEPAFFSSIANQEIKMKFNKALKFTNGELSDLIAKSALEMGRFVYELTEDKDNKELVEEKFSQITLKDKFEARDYLISKVDLNSKEVLVNYYSDKGFIVKSCN